MTKAFDLVKHGLLFRKLNASGIPAILIRIVGMVNTPTGSHYVMELGKVESSQQSCTASMSMIYLSFLGRRDMAAGLMETSMESLVIATIISWLHPHCMLCNKC